MHQMIEDPTALMVRIGELVTAKRQFAARMDDNGVWCLSYGGPVLGRYREDGKVEVIKE